MDFFSILVSVLGGPIFLGGLAFIFRESISAVFKKTVHKEVEKFKQSLEEKTERLKHDLHKEILHAQITTEKRHTVYAEMNKLLTMASDAVKNLDLFEIRMESNYSRMPIEEIEKLLTEKKCNVSEKENIITKINENSEEGIKALTCFLRQDDIFQASKIVRETINFFRLNHLYMSEAVSTAVNQALSPIKRLKSYYQLGFDENPDRGQAWRHQQGNDEALMDLNISEVLQLMRKEISV